MKRIVPFIFLLLPAFLLTSLSQLNAQHKETEELLRCATDQWLEQQMQDPDFAENFRRMENRIQAKSIGRSPSCSNPIILPVAIHWNGDIQDVPCLVDMAENQIEVLNRDFGGYNDDLPNYCEHSLNCPDDYPSTSVTGGTCIQFCLATLNHPPGHGLQNGDPAFTFGQYTFDTDADPWAGYVNIFVSNDPPNGYGGNLLGLAPLYGGANPNGNGVFVHARAFGGFEEECDAGGYTVNNSNSYDEGRTCTHELGHYFGLYHTFQGCGWGDGIADTPSSNEPNYGTPTINYSTCISTAENTCGTQDFFFNYMDYTNDGGMYMFTSDQSDLMYDVATDGNYASDATVCGPTNINYNPLYPNGCYTCPTLSIEATSEDALCFQDCNGTLSVEDVVQGEGPFTYTWSNGSIEPVLENLCAGEYTVTIYDAYNCEVTETFFIEEPDELIANASSSDENGNDFEDGTAMVNPTGGTEPYYYLWSNGETTQTVENLPPGEYTVTVQDFNGCAAVEMVTVEEFICPELTIFSVHEDILCNGECNGFIEVTEVDNGVAPLQYNWSSGQTTNLITDLCAGEYTVTATDAVNCAIVSETIVVIEPLELLIVTESTPETGADDNDGTATVVPDGGTVPYTYAWSNGQTSQTITDLEPGTYTVTVTDAAGCTKEDWTIVAPYDCEQFTIESLSENTGCFDSCDGFIEIMETGNGQEPYLYEWSNGDVDAIAGDLCAGEYEVTISDAAGCETVFEFEITAPEALEALVVVTGETSFGANDGTASVTMSGGTFPYDVEWSNGMNGTEITGLAPGEYTATITDGNGCTTVEAFTINEFTCPDLTVTSSHTDVLCFNACTGELSVDGLTNGMEPYTYEWSNGETSAYIDGLCAGNYEVTVTDANNCSTSTSFEITQPIALIAIVAATDETANDANDGTASVTAEGGTAPYSYTWSNGSTETDITDLAPGNYTVTITDANGCTTTENSIVNEFICPDLSVQANLTNLICFDECTGVIGVTGILNGSEPLNYAWSNGETGPDIDGLCAGEFEVTVTDAKNCTVTAGFELTQPDELLLQVSKTDETGTGSNDGTAAATATGGTPPYTFSWSNGATTDSVDNLQPGTYTVTVTDSKDCTTETGFTIVEFDCTNLSIQSNIAHNPCFGDCLGSIDIINVNNGVEPYSYSWSNGSTESGLKNLCAGTYQVSITDANDCPVEQTFTIEEPEEIIITIDQVVDVNANGLGSIDISTNGDHEYAWTGDNGFVSEEEDLKDLEKGCYTLLVTDRETGCTADTTICVDDLTATDVFLEKEIRLYPNPARDQFTIDYGTLPGEKLVLKVFDWRGVAIKYTTPVKNNEKMIIDANDLTEGIYLVRIRYQDNYFDKKIVIVR